MAGETPQVTEVAAGLEVTSCVSGDDSEGEIYPRGSVASAPVRQIVG
jgi:hypothetical protein